MPLPLDALLLFALPLLLTLAKFVDDTTSRSHQFARSKITLFHIIRLLLRPSDFPDNVRNAIKQPRNLALCRPFFLLLRFSGL